MIAIIDYGAGNLRNVEKALDHLGYECVVTDVAKKILSADKVVLPGVGAFGHAVKSLRDVGMDNVINEVIDKGKPFLGICLGLQLMYEKSEESKKYSGLGVLDGDIKKFPTEIGIKIPQIGWNRVDIKNRDGLFNGIDGSPYFYFVHSYYLDASDKSNVSATCTYGIEYDAAVECKNIFLTQFHPEKSGNDGLKVLGNFAKM